MIKLENQKKNFSILAPTSLKEINFDDVKELVRNVEVSEHYAIVMIAQGLSPMNLALVSSKPDAEVTSSVATYFIKSNDPNHKVNAKLGDKIVTSRSDLERSVHLPVPCAISLSNIAATVQDNPNLRTFLAKGANGLDGQQIKEIVTIAFKLVPLNSIYAVIDSAVKPVDKFRSSIAIA